MTEQSGSIAAVFTDPATRLFIEEAFRGLNISLANVGKDALPNFETGLDKDGVLLFDADDPRKARGFLDQIKKECGDVIPLMITSEASYGEMQVFLPRRDIFVMPFRVGVLIDRIHRHLATDKNRYDDIFIGPYRLLHAECILSGSVDITLTEKERDILVRLYQAQGVGIERKQLLDDVWGYNEGMETHTLETHIYRLRQKIENDPSNPVLLVTDEAGYRLVF